VLHRIAFAVVSEWCQYRHGCFTIVPSRGTHPKLIQHMLGPASIQLTLDRYSHGIPSMGRATASAMDHALEGEEARDEATG
jgi:hypothetical protein